MPKRNILIIQSSWGIGFKSNVECLKHNVREKKDFFQMQSYQIIITQKGVTYAGKQYRNWKLMQFYEIR